MQRSKATPLVFFVLTLSGIPTACGSPGSPGILDHQALLESHDWWDNRDWDWYEANIPFFDSPDAEINTTPVNPGITHADGLNGGDINLYIESLDLGSDSHQRFKTSGIVGNDGWPGYSGAITCTLDTQQPFAWLSPYALKMVIAHAKDAYLYKYDDQAYAILTEYQDLLNTYIELPNYNSIPQQWQFEF